VTATDALSENLAAVAPTPGPEMSATRTGFAHGATLERDRLERRVSWMTVVVEAPVSLAGRRLPLSAAGLATRGSRLAPRQTWIPLAYPKPFTAFLTQVVGQPSLWPPLARCTLLA
jgi:hypothetical protein